MRKNRLFALAFSILLAVAVIAQPVNAQTNQGQNDEEYPKAGFFFGGGMSTGLFNSGPLSVYSDFDILKLSPIKLGAYYELPLGIGNFFAGLEGGFASGSNFGGIGGVSFLPINLNATFAFGIANILYIGPSVKAGLMGLFGHEEYNLLPLLGIGLDLELRYKYFPLSVYGQAAINAYPTVNGFNVLPTLEAGLRFPRGAFGRPAGDSSNTMASGTQGGATQVSAGTGSAPPAAPETGLTPAPTVTSVIVNPATATVNQGNSQQFTATVNGTGSPPQSVTWSVTGGGVGTSISPNGLLSVGANQPAGNLTVTATSTADATKSGTALVTVPAPVLLVPPPAASTVTTIIVNPVTSIVPQGMEQHFTALVEGTGNPPQTVTWSVTGATSGTSINQNGLLTVAQNQTPGELTVRATSTADTTKSGTAIVTVPVSSSQLTPPPVAAPTVTNVFVNPSAATVNQGNSQQFTATVTGTGNPPQNVTWSVSNAAAGTSINQNGLLTIGANQPAGNLTVTATSTADATKSGTAFVTVPAPVAASQPAPATVAPSQPTPVTPPPPAPQRRDILDTSKQNLFAEVHFEPDTAVLIESTRPQLEAAARYLQANPSAWILVRTYTAPFGTAEGRFVVALDRARFCRDYFIRNAGISPERILMETLASERLPENVVIEEWITYRTAELIMIAE